MSDKKFKFDYGDVKKNISENQKLEKESFNNSIAFTPILLTNEK